MCKHIQYPDNVTEDGTVYKHPIVCARCTVADRVKIYREAKQRYYAGKPMFSDAVFDWLEQDIRARDPSNRVLQKVGWE